MYDVVTGTTVIVRYQVAISADWDSPVQKVNKTGTAFLIVVYSRV